MSGASPGPGPASFSVRLDSGLTRAVASTIATPGGLGEPSSRWVAVVWRSSSSAAASRGGRPQEGSNHGGHLQVAGSQRVSVVEERLVVRRWPTGRSATAPMLRAARSPAEPTPERSRTAAVVAPGEDHFAAPVRRAIRGDTSSSQWPTAAKDAPRQTPGRRQCPHETLTSRAELADMYVDNPNSKIVVV